MKYTVDVTTNQQAFVRSNGKNLVISYDDILNNEHLQQLDKREEEQKQTDQEQLDQILFERGGF